MEEDEHGAVDADSDGVEEERDAASNAEAVEVVVVGAVHEERDEEATEVRTSVGTSIENEAISARTDRGVDGVCSGRDHVTDMMCGDVSGGDAAWSCDGCDHCSMGVQD